MPPAVQPKAPSEADLELTILMPCLNEHETLAACLAKARGFLERHQVQGEILVADNGSTDGSQELAASLGARVVPVAEKGYGAALAGGIAAARGRYVIMADADDSYDFGESGRLLEALRGGCDLVMGNRFAGGIRPGAMPFLHRYLGNPVLSWLGRTFFSGQVRDFHCGLRGFHRDRLLALDLRTRGMEFASEMVVKASLNGYRIGEVPVTLHPDGRSRPPHLRTWRDGWRHLRFMLLYAPRWLFLYPGLLLILAGGLLGAWLLPGPRQVGGVRLDVHTLLYAAIAVEIGYQSVLFGVFSKVFAVTEGLLPPPRHFFGWFKRIQLETGLIFGLLLILTGLAGSVHAVGTWSQSQFGDLRPSETLRWVIPSALCLALGCQTILASFFLSILGLKRR